MKNDKKKPLNGCLIALLVVVILFAVVKRIYMFVHDPGSFVKFVIVCIVLWFLGKKFLKWKKEEPQRMQEENQRRQEDEQRRREDELQQFLDFTAPLRVLTTEYTRPGCHSAEETRAAWTTFNQLMEERKFPAMSPLRIFDEIRNRYPNNFRWPDALDRYRSFVRLLMDFYYQVALTYDLPFEEQNKLLYNLKRDPNANACTTSEELNVLLPPEWNTRYLALLEKGCTKNYVPAIYYLAYCYYYKDCVEFRDYDKAFALFQQAGRLGSDQSIYMMGQCYEEGLGTKKNYQKAGDCYKYAYQLSKNQAAAQKLDELYTAQKWDKNKYSPDIFASAEKKMRKDDLAGLQAEAAKLAELDMETADPAMTAVSMRMFLEKIVNAFVTCYEHDSLNSQLSDKISLLRNRGHFTRDIADKAHKIRLLGNRGAHNASGEVITADELREAAGFVDALVRYYEQF